MASASSERVDLAKDRPLRLVRVPKTAELVAGDLRARIVRGELREGDALPPETALMARFGVSRPTLREAFRVLESEGLITVRRGAHGGARVHVPDVGVAARYAGLVLQFQGTTLSDVLDAWAALEPHCAGLLAARRSAADLRRLNGALDEADAALDDPVEGIHLQQQFHALVVELSGNRTLTVLLSMVRHIVETALVSKVSRDAGLPAARDAQHLGHRSHRRLVEHIKARDAVAAERLWRKHIVETTAYLTRDPVALTVVDLLS